MTRKLLYMFICIGLAGSVYAQSNTRGVVTDTGGMHKSGNTLSPHKILLIPFQPKLCMMEIGKDVNANTHLDYSQIIEQFRLQLDLAVYNAFKKDHVIISLLQGRYRSDSVVNYIYASTGYKYDIVPGTTADVGAQDKAKNGNYIHNGQLQVPVDYSKRFMNINITNPNMIGNLVKKYHTDTFVFINELDIKNVNTVTENISDDTYRREVDVHYSIIDINKKAIAKGLVTTYFPIRENDPKQIGEKYFTLVAADIRKNYLLGLNTYKQNDTQKKQATSSLK